MMTTLIFNLCPYTVPRHYGQIQTPFRSAKVLERKAKAIQSKETSPTKRSVIHKSLNKGGKNGRELKRNKHV